MKNQDKTGSFKVEVAEAVLTDLRERLNNTRWSNQFQGASWNAGTDVNYLKELVAYWQKPKKPSLSERKFFKRNERWMQKEGAYALIQSTKPQSFAQGLNDSPVGLAAWLVDKYQAWSDCGGKVESRFTKDELLTHITIYWVTDSIGSSFLPYYDYANVSALTWMKEGVKKWVGSAKVPAAFALFPKDINPAPRELAERFFNVKRWTRMPQGGHFAAMEEPELLAEDIRARFRPFRKGLNT